MNNKHFLAILLSTTFALMVVALYNGFPLAEGDTGAYIQQAIYPHFAPDRTPFYGIFLRITSLWRSLWFPVFAQCLLLGFLIIQFISKVDPIGNKLNPNTRRLLLIVLAIVSLTCAPWVAAYLMPDVFAGILLLAILLFITTPAGNKISTLYTIFILGSLIIHNSHFLITLLFALALLAYSFKGKEMLLVKRSLVLVGLCFITWATLSGMNAAKKYGFVFSRGSNIFMVAKLAETGILNIYLDENCPKNNLRLCNYKTQIPQSLSEFLWLDTSPLNQMGGWDSCRNEYATVVHDVFTSPRYLLMFAQKTATGTLKQLTEVQVRDKIQSEGQDKQPSKKVRQFFGDEWREFSMSKQNTELLTATSCNYVYMLTFLLTTIWILFFASQVISKEVAFLYGCILVFFVLNAFVTATFSTISYRYQYRIFWILPATNLILMIKYYWRAINEPFLEKNRAEK